MTASTAEGLLAAARDLAPHVAFYRERMQKERRMPEALAHVMARAGLFKLWLPRALGGPEVGVRTFVEIVEEVARADGSAGWNLTVNATYSRFGGFLREDVARAIYCTDPDVAMAGTLNPSGKAFPTEGGFRITGRWSYGSGIHHATWVLGSCMVLGETATPEVRIAFFPKRDCEVLDTWRVSGLRGTGSCDYSVQDLFVPEEHTVSLVSGTPTQPGPVYAMPLMTLFSVSIAAVPLGIARAAIEALVDLAGAKTPMGAPGLLRDREGVQADVGRAEALVRSARAFLLESVDELTAAVERTGEASPRQRALVRLASAQAASSSAQAVDLMYNAGGGTSNFEASPLERCFRDVHAATQHIMVSTGNYALGGRLLLGLPPANLRLL